MLFERMLGQDLLHLSCRQHPIHKIMLEEVIHTTMGPSTVPDIGIFKEFNRNWPQMAMVNYKPRIDDNDVASVLQNVADNILQFCFQQIKVVQPRDDHEMLELIIFFNLGHPTQRSSLCQTRGNASGSLHGTTDLCPETVLPAETPTSSKN